MGLIKKKKLEAILKLVNLSNKPVRRAKNDNKKNPVKITLNINEEAKKRSVLPSFKI